MKYRPLVAALALTSIPWVGARADSAFSTPQYDQETQDATVMGRARPEYDPLGARVGGFVLYPALQETETYDSNINATATDERSDFVTSTNPSLDLKSDWGANALNLHASANNYSYMRFSNDDYTDYTVGGEGRLDIYHDARLYGNAGYSILHLPFWSPNTLSGQNKPTEYSDTSFGLAGEKEFDRLSFRLDQNYDYYSFQNVNANGLVALESRNDYADERVNVHTNYELEPGRTVYLLTGYDQRFYNSTSDLNGYNRNSIGYIAAVGGRYDITGLTFLDAYIGYREQDYTDARLGTIAGPTGNLTLTWNVTRLTTVSGSVTRDIDETIIAGASGYFATVETLRVDHELLRNLILNAQISNETDEFQGVNMSDNYVRVGPGVKYLLNENAWISGGYTYSSGNATTVGSSTSDNQIFVAVNLHL